MNLSKNRAYLILAGIVLITAVIRLYQLGHVPHGMTWDEAAIGYNGYSILTTRRDEWLFRFPVSFKSFSDYKAPLAIYLNGPFTYFFGSTIWAVRLPFALAGIFSVVGMYFLLKLSVGKTPIINRLSGLAAASILALSPWHIFISRVGFEAGLSLMFVIWSAVFFLKTTVKQKQNIYFWLSLSMVSGVLSVYAYHSAKIFTPLLAILLLFCNQVYVKKNIGRIIVSGLLGLILIIPLIKDAIYGLGLERAEVTVFSENMSYTDTLRTIFIQITQHLHPNFLIFGQTTNLRHSDGSWGVLLPSLFFLLILFALFFATKLIKKKESLKTSWFFIVWTIIGILPSAISTESPHQVRSLLALPGIIGLLTISIIWLKEWLIDLKINQKIIDSKNKYGLLVPSVIGTLACLHLLFFTSFISDYMTKYNSINVEAFQDGYIEALLIAKDYQEGVNGKPKTDKIVVSSEYGQPYIYVLFLNRTNPIAYQGGALNSYLFLDNIDQKDLQRNDTLLVTSKGNNLPTSLADHIVYGTDGSIRFKIYYLPPRSKNPL
jgi:hypothetical protein